VAPTMEMQGVIVAVDDDAPVLAAVARDLRDAFGEEYPVVTAPSGPEALDLIRSLRLAGRPVAMIVADQRMPGLTGMEFLAKTVELVPEAKRVLLTAWADEEVAIRGINEIRLDRYLLKPWGDPEEILVPALSDLLADWREQNPPPANQLRLVGHTWTGEGHLLRDFLARNLVPFEWLDPDSDPEARLLLEMVGAAEPRLPLVLFPDGTVLEAPTPVEVACKVGLTSRARAQVYDLAVVGAGPAGLAAAVYAASDGLCTLLLEREAPGGQAGRSRRIENYPGFPVGLSGGDLARRALAQARRFGAEVLTPVEVTEIRSEGGYHTLRLSQGADVSARAVLITAGVRYRTLDLPGAEELTGRGVFYGAAISEALAVRDRDVFVLGGGNSAAQAAVYLARFAREVTLLVRARSVEGTMSRYLRRQLEEAGNVQIRTGTELVGLVGEERLQALEVRDTVSSQGERVPAAALFVFIGARPRTDWLPPEVARDPAGYVLSGAEIQAEIGFRRHGASGDGKARPGEPSRVGGSGWPLRRAPLWLETSVPGIFAAGDVRHGSIKGVAAAVGEGAMAVQLIRRHLGGALLTPAIVGAEGSAAGSRPVDPASLSGPRGVG
jgi:thioredoxin reductase (NADPH)